MDGISGVEASSSLVSQKVSGVQDFSNGHAGEQYNGYAAEADGNAFSQYLFQYRETFSEFSGTIGNTEGSAAYPLASTILGEASDTLGYPLGNDENNLGFFQEKSTNGYYQFPYGEDSLSSAISSSSFDFASFSDHYQDFYSLLKEDQVSETSEEVLQILPEDARDVLKHILAILRENKELYTQSDLLALQEFVDKYSSKSDVQTISGSVLLNLLPKKVIESIQGRVDDLGDDELRSIIGLLEVGISFLDKAKDSGSILQSFHEKASSQFSELLRSIVDGTDYNYEDDNGNEDFIPSSFLSSLQSDIIGGLL